MRLLGLGDGLAFYKAQDAAASHPHALVESKDAEF